MRIGLKIHIATLFDYRGELNFRPLNKSLSFEKTFREEKIKLGQRILHFSKKQGLDQEELGVVSNIYSSDISRYINGEENLVFMTLVKLARALKIKMIDFFNHTDKA